MKRNLPKINIPASKNFSVFLPVFLYVFLFFHNHDLVVLGFSDESRHLMDAVFIRDFLLDFPRAVLHPLKYALNYYLHYPALGIFLYYPPFFAVTAGILFLFLGVSLKSASFVLLIFGALCCLFMYLLIREIFENRIALFSTLLIFSNFIIIMWSKKIMLEMPTLCMVSAGFYFLARYIKSGKPSYYYLTILFCVFAFLCKQPALFMWAPAGGLLLLKLKRNIFRFRIWGPFIAGAGAVVLYSLILLYYSRYFVQTASTVSYISSHKWAGLLRGWMYYPLYVWNGFPKTISIFVIPGLFLSVFSSVKKKRLELLIPPLWGLSFYLFNIFIIRSKGPRYAYYFIPPVYVCGVYGIYFLVDSAKGKIRTYCNIFIAAVIFILVLRQFDYAYSYNPRRNFVKGQEFIKGYREAAQYVAGHFKGKCVFFDGWYDGKFIYYIRRYDTKRRIIILRGSKLLASFASFKNIWYKELVKTKRDIYKIIKGYGVRYIVVEERDYFANYPSQLLRNELKDNNNFICEKKIPVYTNIAGMKNQNILVYRYTGRPGFLLKHIILPFPGLGKDFEIPI